MVKNEWKRLLHNPVLIIVLLAIILIPSIYAGFFLASMWDPYGELDKLPVAVVDLDKPVEYNGKTLTVGSDLVRNLKEDGSLDFHFVGKDEARQGLVDGRYYMVITIPEDFSYCASTVTEASPRHMQLQYETNPATNYVAMKLSESAMTKMKLSLEEKVVETYANAVFDSLNDISSGMNDASEGADKLLNGENELTDGVDKLNDGAISLASGTDKLADGATSLNKGASSLNSGIRKYMTGTTTLFDGTVTLKSGLKNIKDGSSKLATGAKDLADGTKTLYTGSKTLAGGTSKLSTGASDLAQGTGSLSDGAAKLSAGAARLSSGINDLSGQLPALSSGVTSLANGSSELNKGIKSYTAGVADSYKGAAKLEAGTTDLSKGLKTLSSSSSGIMSNIESLESLACSIASGSEDPNVIALAQGLKGLKSGYKTFNAGLQDASSSAALLKTGMTSLKDGLKTIDGSSSSLVSGSAAVKDGAGKLKDSLPVLASGVKELSSGAGELKTGASTLSTGAADVDAGAKKVAQAAKQVDKGASELNTGIKQANDGADKLATGASTLSDGAKTAYKGAGDLSGGASKLVSNNDTILDGASRLAQGASRLDKGTAKLNSGASDLKDGTGKLKDSMPELTSGTTDLRDALSEGAQKISETNTAEVNASMFANPVDVTETQITTVPDNGHAMAAYMMSVGLWVASLAFCLMYPLTKHEGITSGFKWWLSKASVLYPMAVAQAVILVLILHTALGFEPARLGQTILVACLTSVAFMSIMYYFNVLLGKVGSFIMLIFMVLQLAGSAGTYPIEVSGSLAAGLNRYMPFTYTVQAFRSSIGGGEPFLDSIAVLLGILIVFSLLTVGLFLIRGRKEMNGKQTLAKIMSKYGFN